MRDNPLEAFVFDWMMPVVMFLWAIAVIMLLSGMVGLGAYVAWELLS